MVALDQLLIARLDGRASRVRVEAQRFQRLGLKRLRLALARLPGVAGSPAEQVEGVAHAVVVAGASRLLLGEIGRTAQPSMAAHGPSRPMAGERLLLETRD